MGWRCAFYSSFFLLTLVESSSRSEKMLFPNLGAQEAVEFSWPVFSASIFVFVALVLSMYLIFEHLASYNQPEFLSLLDSGAAFNWEVIRDCYEAFAFYCFERYLIACLGGEERTIQFMESQTIITASTPLLEDAYSYGVVEHPFPLKWFLKDWYLGSKFYYAVKIGIVQYMILKLICALLAMILQLFGVYGEGSLNGDMVIRTWLLFLISVRPGPYIVFYCSMLLLKRSWNKLDLWPSF